MTTQRHSSRSTRALAKSVNDAFKGWVKRRKLEHEFPDYALRNAISAEVAKAKKDREDPCRE